MTAHKGLVLHVQVGNGDCYGQFSNPANQASSTWWIAKDGTLVQYVDSDLIPWTQAAGNTAWNSVETEGYPSEALTDAQVLTLARLFAWVCLRYNVPCVVTDDVNGSGGMILHGDGGIAWGNHPGCPGPLRAAQRAGAVYLASLVLYPPAPTPSPTLKETSMLAPSPTGGFAVARPDGAVNCFDGGGFFGSMYGRAMNAPVVGISYTLTGKGYWLLGGDGGIFTFGDAVGHGPAFHYLPPWGIGPHTAAPLTGITHEPDGGYAIIADNPAEPAVRVYRIPADNSLAQ